MTKPFDATTKQIVDTDPLAWVRFLGFPGISAKLVDSDFSLMAQADRLIEVTDPKYILHLEMQASYDSEMAERTHFYHVAARRKFKLPVRSVVVLLRKEADGVAMSGHLSDDSFTFRFDVLRVWQIVPDRLLSGPISLLPLAAISQVTEQTVPGIIRIMRDRTEFEGAAIDTQAIWSATLILLGLNYPAEFAQALLAGVTNMKESSTYQSILAEGIERGLERGIALGEKRGIARGEEHGKTEGERQLLILVGAKRFGEPDAEIRQALAAITSAQHLEALASRLLEAKSWRELLNG